MVNRSPGDRSASTGRHRQSSMAPTVEVGDEHHHGRRSYCGEVESGVGGLTISFRALVTAALVTDRLDMPQVSNDGGGGSIRRASANGDSASIIQ